MEEEQGHPRTGDLYIWKGSGRALILVIGILEDYVDILWRSHDDTRWEYRACQKRILKERDDGTWCYVRVRGEGEK